MGFIQLQLGKNGIRDMRLASGSPEEELFLFRVYQAIKPDITQLEEKCISIAEHFQGGRESDGRLGTSAEMRL